METRKYYLDWLRVLAFGLLIPFHVGMLYTGWFYPLKSPRLVPGVEWLLMLSSPWRLALIFLIAGVASAHLIAKLGAGGFARDRLRRLLPVILFGMLVVNAPQTWIVAKASGMTQVGFWEFWPAYLHNDQHVMTRPGLVMPRWDHLWFLLYLLPYGLVFALWRKLRGTRLVVPPLWLLLMGPVLWLVLTNMVIERIWPRTDTLFNDWGAHLQWAALFATGVMLAGRDDAWRWIEARRNRMALVALVLGIGLLIDHGLWLKGVLTPPIDWISYDSLTALYGWSVILAVLGFATYYLNRASPLLSYLNTAILPIYVLHQPILFLAAFAIFPLALPLGLEALLLTVITLTGALGLYHVVIRPFGLMHFLFGLKPLQRKTAVDAVRGVAG